jgi:hypothetical protein
LVPIGEMDTAAAGMLITPTRLVSLYTHVIMPYHRALDLAREKKGQDGDRYDGRGIGPAMRTRSAEVGFGCMIYSTGQPQRNSPDDRGKLHAGALVGETA